MTSVAEPNATPATAPNAAHPAPGGAPGQPTIAVRNLWKVFGPAEAHGRTWNLSPTGDLTEAAANLFAYLRAADRSGASAIAVAPIPAEGLGEAISRSTSNRARFSSSWACPAAASQPWCAA